MKHDDEDPIAIFHIAFLTHLI